MKKIKCTYCNGAGNVPEHDLPSRHGEDGECVSCPVQSFCTSCSATGEMEVADDYQEPKPVEDSETENLPF